MKSLHAELTLGLDDLPAEPGLRRDSGGKPDSLWQPVGLLKNSRTAAAPDVVSAAAPVPLHNYPGPGFAHMTSREWQRLPAACKGSWMECPAANSPGTGSAAMPRQVRVALTADGLVPVYLTDAARTDVRGAGRGSN